MMTDRPIIFSAAMVRALLAGTKTQTRRLARFVHDTALRQWHIKGAGGGLIGASDEEVAQFGPDYAPYAVGDRLWVKEAWNAFAFSQDGDEAWPTKTIPTADEMKEIQEAAYRVDVQAVYRESDRARKWFADQKWRPSIHMPRWASRLTLTVTDVRVQRLQEISEADALAEGVGRLTVTAPSLGRSISAVEGYRSLWNNLHGDDAWEANPWVVAVSFTVAQGNIDRVGA